MDYPYPKGLSIPKKAIHTQKGYPYPKRLSIPKRAIHTQKGYLLPSLLERGWGRGCYFYYDHIFNTFIHQEGAVANVFPRQHSDHSRKTPHGVDKALHTTHGRTTSHGLPHVKQNLHATAGQSHSGTTGRTVGRGKNSLSPSPSPKGRGVITNSRAASLFLASPRSSLRFFPLHSSLFT